jgi:hypothetical protein
MSSHGVGCGFVGLLTYWFRRLKSTHRRTSSVPFFGTTTIGWSHSLKLSNYSSMSEGRIHPGVDVMITIFCDFRQFSVKKMAFFSNTNVMIEILHILALF